MRPRQIYVASLPADAWLDFQILAYRLGLTYQYHHISGRHVVWARPHRRPVLRLVARVAMGQAWARRQARRVGFWVRMGVGR